VLCRLQSAAHRVRRAFPTRRSSDLAGVVIGSGSVSFEMIRHLAELLPVMPGPQWLNNRIEPIAIRDVLYYLARASALDRPVNERSEEHTSELQSRFDLVCRLLPEKK